MKILLISDVYFPRINGVSTSIFTFRRELTRLGHEVVLIAPDYEQPGEESVEVGETLRIAAQRVIFDPEDRLMKWGALRRLMASLAERNFDVVHIQTPFMAHYAGMALARRCQLPCVASYHTFFEEYLYHYLPVVPKSLLRYAARAFSRTQCRQLDAIVVPSQAMMEVLRSYGVMSPIRIIPTGIDVTDLHGGDGADFRLRHAISSDRLLAIYVGRVAFEKKIELLLHIIQHVRVQVPQVLLVVVGDGPARPHLQRLTVRLGIQDNVLFVGYLTRHGELRDAYHAADALVFASDTETQGLVLLEAMALGVAVVSTAQMGTRDILQGNCGAVIAEDNVTDFSRKLRYVLTDANLRARLAREGIIYAQEWTAQAMAIRMAAFYGEVCH